MASHSALKLAALLLAGLSLPGVSAAHEFDPSALPLSDGNVARTPGIGMVYVCQARFNPNAPGAQRSGDWLDTDGNSFDLTRKPIVDGQVRHVSDLYVSVAGETRVITGNALPDHPTGVFPVSRSDDAYFYDRNPNRIQAHRFTIRLPVTPSFAADPSCLPMGAVGISLTGAMLFNALDARGENALAHEILDRCQGHPQRGGLYHYHGMSPCQEDAGNLSQHSALIGYAFDGFGIYGPRDVDGHILNSSELDACHGHTGPVKDQAGSEQLIYHYHATQDYPYTLGCFRGTVQHITWHDGAPRGDGRIQGGNRPPRGPGNERGHRPPPRPF